MSRPAAIDAGSTTWQAVAAWLNAEVERARAELETPGLDALTTERARGRIQLARALLGATTPPPVIATDANPHYT
jgi:hypothetical protein